VLLSLARLHARSLWHTLMGGTNGLSLWGDDDDESSRSYYSQTQNREIESAESPETAPQAAREQVEEPEEYEDGPWYIGKARDEFNRRLSGGNVERLAQDDDPVQWARDRRAAESERDNDYGPEDYFDGMIRGRPRDDDEEVDEFSETTLLVVLCLMVSALLYVRGRWMERLRREEQQRQQQQQQAGGAPVQQPPPPGLAFPPAGDPVAADWAILR